MKKEIMLKEFRWLIKNYDAGRLNDDEMMAEMHTLMINRKNYKKSKKRESKGKK